MKGRKIVLYFLFFLLISLIAFAGVSMTVQMRQKDDRVIYDGPFTVSDGESVQNNVSLQTYEIGHLVKRGETFVVTGTLPDDLPEGTALQTVTYLSPISIAVDGREVYSYGKDLYAEGSIVGSGFHFAELPADAGGKSFRLTITAGEPNAFSNISPCYLMGRDSSYMDFAGDNYWNVIIGVFMVVLGIITGISSLIMAFFRPGYRRLIYVSLFSALLGTWILCNTKAIQLFSDNMRYNTILEYVALYTAVIPIYSLLRSMRDDAAVWKKRIMNACITVSILFAMVACILQSSNVLHVSNLLRVFHILSALSVLAFACTALKRVRDMSPSEKMMNLAVLLMMTMAGLDMLRFNLMKYFFENEVLMQYSILPAGALAFIVMLFISTLYYFYELVQRQARVDSLEKTAYEEPVTGLYNRAYAEKRFRELSAGPDAGYAFVNFDLNGLKRTNDTCGHAVGDRLIHSFGEALKQSFRDIGEPIRMGGDEFMAICEKAEADEIRKALSKLGKLCRDYSEALPVPISFAWGLAESGQVLSAENNFTAAPSSTTAGGQEKGRNAAAPGGAELVYQAADKAMYEMKAHMKKEEKEAEEKERKREQEGNQ